jgi:hypothetical protein
VAAVPGDVKFQPTKKRKRNCLALHLMMETAIVPKNTFEKTQDDRRCPKW